MYIVDEFIKKYLPRFRQYDHIYVTQVSGNLTNTGHDVSLMIDEEFVQILNASLGPMQYNYKIYQVKVHFGREEDWGSEHTINGQQFPAEVLHVYM